MSLLTPLQMPDRIAATATLATQVVDAFAPPWVTSDIPCFPSHSLLYSKTNTKPQIVFRIPNMGGAIPKWLFTRPAIERISEDAFERSAVESTTIFRIHGFANNPTSVVVTPSVSNHWLMMPCRTINGFTFGLAFIDVLHRREEPSNCIPPVPIGRFVIEDSSGEIFVTGWTETTMICGWIQSIITCERVRELLMYQAPLVDGLKPTKLLLRNSFYERRACHICGQGPSLSSLREPCLRNSPHISNNGNEQQLTNVAALYRRFRGNYFGICVKSIYGATRNVQQVQPIFIDVRHGLHSVRRRFRKAVRKNISFELDSVESYFGLHPRTSRRTFLLMPKPVETGYPLTSHPEEFENENLNADSTRNLFSTSSSQSDQRGVANVSTQTLGLSSGRRRRERKDDDVNRWSAIHIRKVKNRESAQRCNQLRKKYIEQTKSDLAKYKALIPDLSKQLEALREENDTLRKGLVEVVQWQLESTKYLDI